MLKWLGWALVVWGVMFLAPPTRPFAVYFLPLESVGGDVLGVIAFSFLVGGSSVIAVQRIRNVNKHHRLERQDRIEELERELFK